MADKIFVDTNVLVYAHDVEAGQKRAMAAEWLDRLWVDRNGVASLQVLQELYVTVTQKLSTPLAVRQAAHLLAQYSQWEVALLKPHDLLAAIEWQRRHGLPFWDALIVQAGSIAGCRLLLSEDFTDGQRFGRLQIRNPFLHAPI